MGDDGDGLSLRVSLPCTPPFTSLDTLYLNRYVNRYVKRNVIVTYHWGFKRDQKIGPPAKPLGSLRFLEVRLRASSCWFGQAFADV